MERTGDAGFSFLWWNLFLAVVPLLASTALRSARRPHRRPVQLLCFSIWLLFLPNAPYILTDLLHLHPRELVPLWYDLVVLMSCAGTGLFLGYISLLDVQLVIEKRFGKHCGWGVAVSALLLSGFGIYLGRFLRWNSWEVFTNPWRLLSTLGELARDHGDQPNPLVVTLVFGTALTLGYAALRVLGAPVADTSAE
jgi:uncharacterized membrane protein